MKSAPGVLVPVRLTSVGRPQHALVADPATASSLLPGNQVVVETEAGATLGTVAAASPEVARRQCPGECPPRVIRIATAEDVAVCRRQREREAEAYRVGLMKVRERGLAMKLTRVEHLFDASRLIFYFTAEGRVDFRGLVRELASEFHTRIEMRQVGVRDEARMLGGYGSCGRPLCCTTWLQSFEPISIKMAKQQELSLNPSKLSGLCGRLKCCLRYELANGADPKEAGEAARAGAGHAGEPSERR
jgi:cell fate regulator YaaT (PSP1 superfamily)